jgi:hypothetical protein
MVHDSGNNSELGVLSHDNQDDDELETLDNIVYFEAM